MREDRQAVNELNGRSVLGLRLGDVAFIYVWQSIAADGIFHALLEIGKREIPADAWVPLKGKCCQPLACGTRVVGHDRDRILNAHDLLDALYRHGRSVVDRTQLAAKMGTDGDCGVGHAFRTGIDTELRRTVDLLRTVQTFDRLADQLEARRRLQWYFLRNRLQRSSLNQAAIGTPAVTRRMDDVSRLGFAAIRLHTPTTGSSIHQHDARSGSRLAHLVVNGANGKGTASDLIAQQGVRIPRGIGGRMLENQLIKRDFQLFCQQHRNRSVDPLSHLHGRHDQDNLAFGRDPNEGVGLKRLCCV